jgi:PST family polysaccharide transporter
VLLQFALLPVLAHLLAPADFGLVGMAMPVVVGANLLSDFGLGNVLMRAPEATPRLQSTIFWSTVAIGAFLALIFAGAAPFLGSALQHPALTPILVMLAPVLIFGGAVTAPSAQLVRDQRYASFAVSDAASAIGGGLVCLAAAYANFGAWALVAQQLTYWCIRFIWIMRVSGARHGPQPIAQCVFIWRERDRFKHS